MLAAVDQSESLPVKSEVINHCLPVIDLKEVVSLIKLDLYFMGIDPEAAIHDPRFNFKLK